MPGGRRPQSPQSPCITGDVEELYGRDFAEVLSRPPDSAFLAEGSPVTVYRPERIA